jgi:hypothetical protein
MLGSWELPMVSEKLAEPEGHDREDRFPDSANFFKSETSLRGRRWPEPQTTRLEVPH